MKKNAAALLAVSLLAAPAISFAALAGSNTVNSAAIIDGEVKTADLANLGVTNAKIAASAVSDAKISDVGMAKVTGLSTALAGKADLAHVHLLGNMTVVATEGGEYTSPAAAMTNVATWCGTPSASNPCLIKVMPGVYDLGTSNLPLSNVSIVGSGAAVTKITSASTSGTAYCNGTVSIQDITLENTSWAAMAVASGDYAAISISDSAIIAGSATSQDAYAVAPGRYASLKMNNSAIQSSSTTHNVGIESVYMTDLSLIDVTIDASSAGVQAGTGYPYATGLDLIPAYGGNIFLDGVRVKASGNGNITTGLKISSTDGGTGTIRLNNVVSTSTGSIANTAVGFGGSGTATMNNVTGVADGGSSNTGLVLQSYYYGTGYAGPHNVEIMNSSFKGSYAALLSNGLATDVGKIANTKLDGPVSNLAGTLVCNNNMDGNFATVTCP